MSEAGKLKFGTKKKFEPQALQFIQEVENEEDESLLDSTWLPGRIEPERDSFDEVLHETNVGPSISLH